MDVVVILNYKGRSDTERCVASVLKGSQHVTVLVVDNGSEDGVLASVTEQWPSVHTLQNGENLGFAGGMNAGIRWALTHGAESICVLNNDTIVPPGAFDRLAEVARSGVAVSPEIYYADRDELWFGGGTIDSDSGLARHMSLKEVAAVPRDENGLRPCRILAGCCVMASAEVWRRVGLFDERFFLIFEDSDWSVRATRKGVTLAVDPAVRIRHSVSASFTGAFSYLGLFFYVRNAAIFVLESQNGTPLQLARLLRRQVVPGLASLARSGRTREFGRRSTVILAGVGAYAIRRWGPAPLWLQARARSWARDLGRAPQD